MNNKTETLQPQPKADQPVAQIQTTPPVQPIKKSNTLLILVVFVLTLIIIGLLGYILLTGQTEKLQTTTLPTPTELPMPTTNIIPSTSPVVSPSPAATVTLTVKPTIIPNPDGNTFTSNKMGVAFYYANKAPADSTGSVKVLESGSTVYVYISSGKPENGQFIERFDKSPTDTLAQAISKKFLAGISPFWNKRHIEHKLSLRSAIAPKCGKLQARKFFCVEEINNASTINTISCETIWVPSENASAEFFNRHLDEIAFAVLFDIFDGDDRIAAWRNRRAARAVSAARACSRRRQGNNI